MLIQGFTAATSANVLAGELFEFLRRPSRVSVAVMSDVALNAGNTWSFQIADRTIAQGEVIMPPAAVNTATSFIAGIIYPDNYHIQNEPGFPNDRLVLGITRAAGNILWSVQIIEVA